MGYLELSWDRLGSLGGRLEPSWSRFEGHLGPSGLSMGHLDDALGTSWPILGHLGLSMSRLGAVLGSDWAIGAVGRQPGALPTKGARARKPECPQLL